VSGLLAATCVGEWAHGHLVEPEVLVVDEFAQCDLGAPPRIPLFLLVKSDLASIIRGVDQTPHLLTRQLDASPEARSSGFANTAASVSVPDLVEVEYSRGLTQDAAADENWSIGDEVVPHWQALFMISLSESVGAEKIHCLEDGCKNDLSGLSCIPNTSLDVAIGGQSMSRSYSGVEVRSGVCSLGAFDRRSESPASVDGCLMAGRFFGEDINVEDVA
jgi:hypothetical protein